MEARERWLTRVLATLYLQRMWISLLTLALSSTHFWLAEAPFQAAWRARQLPPPWFGDGQPGLAVLGAWQRQATGLPARFEEDWLNQAQHLIRSQLRRSMSGSSSPDAATLRDQAPCETSAELTALVADAPCVVASLAAIPQASRTSRSSNSSMAAGQLWPYGDHEPDAADMRMRQPVERSTIEAFLQELGRRVRRPGKLYLTGGAALVHAGLRGEGAATAAIDLKLDTANEEEVQDALRQLQDQLHIDLKLVWPGDFLPEPPAWEAGSQYVGRYGALEVFSVDFVFLALAKVARGSERDLGDLEALAQSSVVTQQALQAAAETIRPYLGHGRFFNVDLQRFDAQLAMATQRVWGRR